MLLANSAKSLKNQAVLACKFSELAENRSNLAGKRSNFASLAMVFSCKTSVHPDDRRTFASFASAIAQLARPRVSLLTEHAGQVERAHASPLSTRSVTHSVTTDDNVVTSSRDRGGKRARRSG